MNIEELKITNEDINLLKEMKENCLKASVYKDEKRLLKANAIAKFLVEYQEKQELIEFLKEEQDRLARECSHIYEDSLGRTRLVSEDIYNEVSKILSKIEKSDK